MNYSDRKIPFICLVFRMYINTTVYNVPVQYTYMIQVTEHTTEEIFY